jgi:hypothetical protein
VEALGLTADPVGSEVADAAMPRGQCGHRMDKDLEEDVQTPDPGRCPAGMNQAFGLRATHQIPGNTLRSRHLMVVGPRRYSLANRLRAARL